MVCYLLDVAKSHDAIDQIKTFCSIIIVTSNAFFFYTKVLTIIIYVYMPAIIGWEPPHHCTVPNNQNLNETIPPASDGTLAKCHMYTNYSLSNDTMECDSWQYDTGGFNTIVNEVY